MKKSLFLLLLVSTIVQAQYTVKGTVTSADRYSAVYLYKVEGAKQLYVNNTQISKQNDTGAFQFALPATTKPGIYRAIYDLQQRNAYVEFLFNKENVEFSFDAANKETTTVFKESKENKLYDEYLKEVSEHQYVVDSLQRVYLRTPTQAITLAYKKAINKLNNLQNNYEEKASGTLAYHFIKATERYNANSPIKDADVYFQGAQKHFFDYIDFNNPQLYNSSFLVDRITDYIFYMNYSQDPKAQEGLYKKAIDLSLSKITNVSFKAEVIEYLISNFVAFKKTPIVEYLFTNHFNTLPKANQNLEFKNKIQEALAVTIGNIAPDFSWEENGRMMSLSSLKDGQNYLLIFYSTECPHCVRELPQVFSHLKGNTKTKVIAFGMETSDKKWNTFIKGFPGWHHALGLNKWENETARKYQINSTPTYFVLGSDKKIIANPDTIEDLKGVLKTLK